MRRWPLFILFAALAGCASDREARYPEADGPYCYDGGYYDSPRPVDIYVEQRAYYGYDDYPRPYPYYYGGYNRYYHRPDRDYRHDDDRDRVRIRADRSPEPPPRRVDDGDRDRSRAVPDRPAKINAGDRPGRSASGNRSGGPRGGSGKR